MARWFWYFWGFSFLGWGLERLYAAVTRAPAQRRRCLLFAPLCPVYGLGMTALLALPAPLRSGWLLGVTGAAVCTAAEYLYHWVCEAAFGVRFWDYSTTPGNVRGRVCLPFTLAWGALSAAAALALEPPLRALGARVLPEVTLAAALAFTADAVCTARYLSKRRSADALRHAFG